MLVKHTSQINFPIYITTGTGSYCVQDMQGNLSPAQHKYITIGHGLTGNDTVSNIHNQGKWTSIDRLCSDASMHKHLDVFNAANSTHDEIANAGIAIFQFLYRAPHIDLHQTRYHMYSQHAKNGNIKPELLPPTKGAVTQHALRAYLQNQDWLELKSMSRDPTLYGFKIGSRGYEPITSLDDWAPEDIKKLISCKCKAQCDTKRCSCKKAGVKCISACGICKGVTCNNANEG